MEAAGGYLRFEYPHQPHLLYTVRQAYAAVPRPYTNFLKGVQWSPDGSCLLTASDDGWLRLYDLPPEAATAAAASVTQGGSQGGGEAACGADGASAADPAAPDGLAPGVQSHAGETIYDYCWYSRMSVADPVTCCYASSSRGHPIQLWDACSGQLRCSYRGYDAMDEPTAAISLAFSPDGSRLLGGYNKALRVFDVNRPGRDCKTIVTQAKRKEGSIPGMISCIAFSPGAGDLVAAGSYSGAVALFDGARLHQQLLLKAHTGGVTQVRFSPDGNFLYTGARQDGAIHCWDVRHTGDVLYSMARDSGATNQRIAFDIEPVGQHLLTGGCDGHVRVFNLSDGSPAGEFAVADDTVNGCSLHPLLPLLATASGQRRYPLAPASDDGEGERSEGEAEGGAGGAASGSGRGRQRGPVPALQQAAAAAAAPAAASSSTQLPGMCNALRVWQLRSEWLPLEAGEGGEGEAGAAEAAGAAEGQQPGDGGAGAAAHQPQPSYLDALPVVQV